MAYTPYNPYMNMNQFYPQQPIPDQMNQMRNPYQQPIMNQQMPVNQQQQQMQPIQQIQSTIPTSGISPVSRPVGNREEAMAAQIPFDNSISVFTDLSHGKIYTKSFNMNDGSSVFRTFCLEQDTPEKQTNVASEDLQLKYATIDEVDMLKEEIESLKAKISEFSRAKTARAERSEKTDKQEKSA